MPFRPENNLKPDQETEEKLKMQKGPFIGFALILVSEIGRGDGSEPPVSQAGARTPAYWLGYPPYPDQEP